MRAAEHVRLTIAKRIAGASIAANNKAAATGGAAGNARATCGVVPEIVCEFPRRERRIVLGASGHTPSGGGGADDADDDDTEKKASTVCQTDALAVAAAAVDAGGDASEAVEAAAAKARVVAISTMTEERFEPRLHGRRAVGGKKRQTKTVRPWWW